MKRRPPDSVSLPGRSVNRAQVVSRPEPGPWYRGKWLEKNGEDALNGAYHLVLPPK